MGYSVEFRPAAFRSFKELPAREQVRVSRAIDKLRLNPFSPSCEKLQGTDYWRIRAGNYRVVYTVQQSSTTQEPELAIVVIIRIGHRPEVYRHL
jgi:mRNA interferase RelE/StbE